MRRSLRVKTDPVCPRFGKGFNEAIDGRYHQMHIDRRLRMWSNRLAEHRPQRQVGDVMVIHDIKVNPVGPGRDNVTDFFTHSVKFVIKNTGRDGVHGRTYAENRWWLDLAAVISVDLDVVVGKIAGPYRGLRIPPRQIDPDGDFGIGHDGRTLIFRVGGRTTAVLGHQRFASGDRKSTRLNSSHITISYA